MKAVKTYVMPSMGLEGGPEHSCRRHPELDQGTGVEKFGDLELTACGEQAQIDGQIAESAEKPWPLGQGKG